MYNIIKFAIVIWCEINMGVNFMSKNNDKNKKGYYFPLCIGMGLVFGVVLDQIAIGLCLGVVIGLILDGNKKKKID